MSRKLIKKTIFALLLFCVNNEFVTASNLGDRDSIFIKSSSKSSDYEPVITTTESPKPDDLLSPSVTPLIPLPTKVKKTKGREAKHTKNFKKAIGYEANADTYAKDKGQEVSNAQIGHAQAYVNHGAEADSRESNLAVINRTSNHLMKKADNLYKDDDIDGNCFLVKLDTLVSRYTLQMLEDVDGNVITPIVVINANSSPLNVAERKKFNEEVSAALDPSQINLAHDKLTKEMAINYIRKKINDYEKKNLNFKYKVFKFSNFSGSF